MVKASAPAARIAATRSAPNRSSLRPRQGPRLRIRAGRRRRGRAARPRSPGRRECRRRRSRARRRRGNAPPLRRPSRRAGSGGRPACRGTADSALRCLEGAARPPPRRRRPSGSRRRDRARAQSTAVRRRARSTRSPSIPTRRRREWPRQAASASPASAPTSLKPMCFSPTGARPRRSRAHWRPSRRRAST